MLRQSSALVGGNRVGSSCTFVLTFWLNKREGELFVVCFSSLSGGVQGLVRILGHSYVFWGPKEQTLSLRGDNLAFLDKKPVSVGWEYRACYGVG